MTIERYGGKKDASGSHAVVLFTSIHKVAAISLSVQRSNDEAVKLADEAVFAYFRLNKHAF
ncbi:hypothetical protein GCM10028809_02050 [Spirosoma gilvum]